MNQVHQQFHAAEALELLAQAANCLLTIQNAPYRVTADDVIITRRDGYTILALPETRNVVDWRQCAPPYSTMDNEPRPAGQGQPR
jgi:hypothetical protein